MADTANFGWTKPTVGGDGNQWGAILNTALDDIDTDLKAHLPRAAGAANALTGPLVALTPAAGGSGYASLRLPHGAAPTDNLTNGDIWTTTAGVFARINGATVGPLAAAGGAVTVNNDNWSGADLAVENGGTGSSTAAGARTNLTAAKSGANSDITSLTGLTTPLSIAQGGTGGATASAARGALGLAIGSDVQAYDADLTSVSNNRILGNVSGSTATPAQLTAGQVADLIESSLDLSQMTMGTGSGFSGVFKIGPLWVQAGSVSVTPAQNSNTGEGSVTFPTEFPTACLGLVATPSLSIGYSSSINVAPYVRGLTKTSCNIGLDQDSAASLSAVTVYWLAVGY